MKKILTLAFAAFMTLSLSAFAATSDDKLKADDKKAEKAEKKEKKKEKKPHAF